MEAAQSFGSYVPHNGLPISSGAISRHAQIMLNVVGSHQADNSMTALSKKRAASFMGGAAGIIVAVLARTPNQAVHSASPERVDDRSRRHPRNLAFLQPIAEAREILPTRLGLLQVVGDASRSLIDLG